MTVKCGICNEIARKNASLVWSKKYDWCHVRCIVEKMDTLLDSDQPTDQPNRQEKMSEKIEKLDCSHLPKCSDITIIGMKINEIIDKLEKKEK